MHHGAMYEADRGIRRSYYYDDGGMTAGQRDELIWKLHQRGFSQGKIARQLGNTITQQGISRALKRIAAGRVGAGPRG